MLGTDIIAWYGRHWLLLIGFASLQSCLRLFMELRGNAWYGRHRLLLIGFVSLQVVFVCSWSCGAILGTDVIGCCFLDLLSFKLSSYVSGVSGQGLVRTSLVGAYWIRFSSSCLRLFMKFQGYVGTDIIGCCLLDALPFHVAFVCSRSFWAMLDTDIIGLASLQVRIATIAQRLPHPPNRYCLVIVAN